MKEEEKKKAINCRFQPNESDDFFHWLNNQSNMTLAIRNLIYHAIDLYGTEDFLAPDTQKEVMRNTFMFEAVKNSQAAPANPFSHKEFMSEPVKARQVEDELQGTENHEIGTELNIEPKQEPKEDPKEDPKESSIYQNIDIDNL